MSQIVLYDLRERAYPNQRGDVFRVVQVIICSVCGAQTNKVVMGGYPGYGVRTICPNSSECWHHELEAKVSWLHEKPHPKIYRDALETEIGELKLACQDKIVHDVEGEPDRTLTGWFCTNTFSRKVGFVCRHGF